jgi:hypothetical protein
MRFGLRYRINKRPKVDCYPSSSVLNTSPLPSTSIELKDEKKGKGKVRTGEISDRGLGKAALFVLMFMCLYLLQVYYRRHGWLLLSSSPA